METRCQKCGAGLAADQAFCAKCGAVVGMGGADTERDDEGWDMATTMTGQQMPQPTRPRPSAERQSLAARDAAAPPPKGGNAVLLAVIGFVAVLAIAGLVILLLYLNSQG
ncbi:MAG TPA: zinc ribbon domain-containing protein [Pyrinomonadaceae bacterium]|jgi:hypothetical protein